jgi:hypothetical protein
LVTTAPAPTIVPSPIVTPGTTVTETPSHTLRPIRIRGWGHICAPVGVDAVVQGGEGGAVADESAVSDGDAAGVLEAAPEVDEDVLAEGEVLAELVVEGWEERHRLIWPLAGELARLRTEPARTDNHQPHNLATVAV